MDNTNTNNTILSEDNELEISVQPENAIILSNDKILEKIDQIDTNTNDIKTINSEIDTMNDTINNLADGSPKGVFDNVAALVAGNPASGVYLTKDNGHIYSWMKDGTTAVDLGVYQAVEVNDYSISPRKTSFLVQGINKFFIEDTVYDDLHISYNQATGITTVMGSVTRTGNYKVCEFTLNKETTLKYNKVNVKHYIDTTVELQFFIYNKLDLGFNNYVKAIPSGTQSVDITLPAGEYQINAWMPQNTEVHYEVIYSLMDISEYNQKIFNSIDKRVFKPSFKNLNQNVLDTEEFKLLPFMAPILLPHVNSPDGIGELNLQTKKFKLAQQVYMIFNKYSVKEQKYLPHWAAIDFEEEQEVSLIRSDYSNGGVNLIILDKDLKLHSLLYDEFILYDNPIVLMSYLYMPSLGKITYYNTYGYKFNIIDNSETSYQENLTISILGDSISSYLGWIPDNYAAYYGDETNSTNVDSVTQTYWYKLINKIKGNLLINCSYSGSTISTTGYGGNDATATSFITRMKKYLGEDRKLDAKPDVIIIFGGTNDSWAGSPVGSVKYSDWTTDDLKQCLPAFCYMLDYLKLWNPGARIINLVNTTISGDIKNGMATATAHYNVENIILPTFSGHPNQTQMDSIYNILLPLFKK